MAEQSYDSSTYYDCCDSEVLHCATPEEAIEEWLELRDAPEEGKPLCDWIREHAPVEVTTYKRDAVSDAWYRNQAGGLADDAETIWWRQYGNPDIDVDSFREELAKEFEAALRRVVGPVKVWLHSPCGKREYSADEVIAMMRRPEVDGAR
jgi:hypothetical protein